LNAGNRLWLRRDCEWTTGLVVSKSGTEADPIIVSAYGEGADPVLRDSIGAQVVLNGSYIVLRNMRATLQNPPVKEGCINVDTGLPQPYGWRVGFSINGNYNTLEHVEASNLAVGIRTSETSHHNTIRDSYIHHNNMLWRLDDGTYTGLATPTPMPLGGSAAQGANGFNFLGDDHAVIRNTFEENRGFCKRVRDGKVLGDGIDIELYNANRSMIRHNVAINSPNFTELGATVAQGKTASDNTYAYNLYINERDSTGIGFVVQGAAPFGPIYNNRFLNNTVYVTGERSQGFVGANAEVRNNILFGGWKSAFFGSGITESNNLYWRVGGNPYVQFFTAGAINSTSRKANPMLTDTLHLSLGSPAINAGMDAGYKNDLDGVDVENPPEIGVYEFR
jgi:hypothetical protein